MCLAAASYALAASSAVSNVPSHNLAPRFGSRISAAQLPHGRCRTPRYCDVVAFFDALSPLSPCVRARSPSVPSPSDPRASILAFHRARAHTRSTPPPPPSPPIHPSVRVHPSDRTRRARKSARREKKQKPSVPRERPRPRRLAPRPRRPPRPIVRHRPLTNRASISSTTSSSSPPSRTDRRNSVPRVPVTVSVAVSVPTPNPNESESESNADATDERDERDARPRRTDRRTDGPTDRRTDRATARPSPVRPSVRPSVGRSVRAPGAPGAPGAVGRRLVCACVCVCVMAFVVIHYEVCIRSDVVGVIRESRRPACGLVWVWYSDTRVSSRGRRPTARCEIARGASDARLDASRGGRGGRGRGRRRRRRARRARRRPRARTGRRWGGVVGRAHRAGTFARRASGVERRGTRITREGAVGWTRGRKGRGETRGARARDCVERTRRRVRDRGWSTLSEDASRRRDSGRRSGRARGRGRRGEREESAAR